MMNQWDRERMWQETPGAPAIPSSGNGWAWLVAVIVAVIAIVVFARSNGNQLVLVPIAISVFFMFMFMVNHRRETRRLEAARAFKRLEEAARKAQGEPMGMEPGTPARNDVALRKVFDRFDLRVIQHGRANNWQPKQLSSLLEMARDFVDTPHATQLQRSGDDDELDRHLLAALERALLQYDIANDRKGDTRRGPYDFIDEPPF
jgi:hypothetical protein